MYKQLLAKNAQTAAVIVRHAHKPRPMKIPDCAPTEYREALSSFYKTDVRSILFVWCSAPAFRWNGVGCGL